MSTTSTTHETDQQSKSFFGQPRVLANLFGVEMWERFSFYGMQGILLIYLYYSADRGGLGIDKGVAAGIVGAYGGGVYLSTILGAWLADRLIGAERTLFYSAVVVMAGHVALSLVPGLAGVGIGLVLIAFGSGGVKANATSLVGSLYAEHDERRDAGFSLFYMGINLGALVGPLLTGLLQTTWGFHVGFALAALGMAAGLVQYALGRSNLPAETQRVPNPLPRGAAPRYGVLAVVAVAAVVALSLAGVITADRLATIVAWASGLAAVAYFAVILLDREITRVERQRVYAFIPMFVASAVFWSLYQQQFTVVTIYSDERLDREPVRLGDAGLVGAVDQPGLHHRAGRRVRRDVDPAGGPAAVHAGEVRPRHGQHRRLVPAVRPDGRRRREQRPPARPGRRAAVLHDLRAAAVPGGSLAVDQAGAGEVPHPDGGAVLPVHRARHRAVGPAQRLLRRAARGALLPRARRRRDRRGRRAARDREAGRRG